MNNVMVHVNNVCWLGGTMLHTLTVCKAYPEFRHVVYYVHSGASPQMVAMLKEAGVETRILIDKKLRCDEDIAPLDPALVILNNTPGAFIEGVYPFSWLRAWPTVFYHHGPTHPVIPCDLDIFNSRHLYETRYTKCRAPMTAVRFVGSYVDADLFAKAVRPRPRTDQRVKIGKLASDQDVKFPSMIPRIFKRVEKVLGHNKVSFDIVGGSKYYPKLGNDLVVYQAPDFGSRPVQDFYADWDILLYITTDNYAETWCRVITEAMASGLAIVAEHKGAIPEQITHGEEGLLVKPHLPGASVSQADADIRCETTYVNFLVDLAQSASRCRTLGENAREKAVREFSFPAFRRKTIDALMGVMAGIRIESEA
jgi:glycosyltransferase involved in cell wall biosynthesis